MMARWAWGCLLVLLWGHAWAQQETPLRGYLLDPQGQGIEQAVVVWTTDSSRYTVTRSSGYFELRLPAGSQTLRVYFLGKEKTFSVQMPAAEPVRWIWENLRIEEVVVEAKDTLLQEEVSAFRFTALQAKRAPTPFGDFNKILATLPGVVSNNELSSSYSVRGGNYDENLLYVNGMMVYRPLLIRAGQQEGLSFVNPDLVEEVRFYSGGWQAAYGDKLSSLMLIRYKEPKEFKASVSAGILNSAAHVEGSTGGGRLTYVAGVRRKSARYLLNTLPVKGQYLPNFIDVQAWLTYKLSARHSLKSLLTYARNRYFVQPDFAQTDFGTVNRKLRLSVGFDGQEQMRYDITQNSLQLESHWNDQLKTQWVLSYMRTVEREFTEVEGAYRLCEVGQNYGAGGFNQCVKQVGAGSNYLHLRNRMGAWVAALENRSAFHWRQGHLTEWGMRWSYETVEEFIDEYRFVDSAGYVRITEQIDGHNRVEGQRLSFFAQQSLYLDSLVSLRAGVRATYWTYNNEWNVSPSLQWSVRRRRRPDWVWRGAVGLYQQPPFYRELRDFAGQLHPGVRAQQAWHVVMGADLLLPLLGRPFRFTAEAYYKHLMQLNPYDVENVRIRYYARNDATGYAAGLDMRLNGELIRGTESWISLSLLRTEEDLAFDDRGYLRRPMDQRLTVGVYLEDHLPSNPSWRVNMQLQWGTGLPFGVPNEPAFRSAFQGRAYRRVDLGFSKYITDVRWRERPFLKSLWIGADILNVLGINNVISYTWIEDVSGQRYAVPNTLSARFLNFRIVGEF
ncbi:TonB-dependent receptor [Thermonema rossianum]|uniref:TonB-dependent receptor n=1 Tax=Thermonema rossianum TaxID=55505 RepID=UPI0009FF0887|nr:TonB-dependent receptor [Thermonema rossianum]